MGIRKWVGRLAGAVTAVAVFVIGGVSVTAQGPFTAQIQLFYQFLKTAPQTVTGTWTFQNVVVNGTCTGCGGGGGTPASPTTSVQFNNAGAFGGSSHLLWDGVTFTIYPNDYLTPGVLSSALAVLPNYEQNANAGNMYAWNLDPYLDAKTFNINLFAGASFGAAYIGGAGTATSVRALDGNIRLLSGNVTDAYGSFMYVQNYATTTTRMIGNYSSVQLYGGTVATGASFWADASDNSNAGTMATYFSYYAAEVALEATNAYSFWSDEAGVYRIRSDNTFNAVYQGIAALYNPQFTKYTPGAANHERCIPGCQWESNVAVITTEKGGTGTLRGLRLGNAGVNLSTLAAGLYTPAATSIASTSANSCGTTAPALSSGSTNTAGKFTVGATAGTDCTLTFSVTATTGWTCAVSNTTTANLIRAVPATTTTTKFLGTMVASDVVQYACNPY